MESPKRRRSGQKFKRHGGRADLKTLGRRRPVQFRLDLIQTKAARRPLARNFTHHEIIAFVSSFLFRSGIQTRFLLFMRKRDSFFPLYLAISNQLMNEVTFSECRGRGGRVLFLLQLVKLVSGKRLTFPTHPSSHWCCYVDN